MAPTFSMTANTEQRTPPSRIVVRGTNWVGDTVISLPAAKELKRIFSGSQITFWVPSGLDALVRATGIPSQTVCFDRNSGGALQRSLAMRGTLARERFDLAVLFQNAFESAFTSWLARIRLRAGYGTDLRGPLLNVRVPLRPDIRLKHQVFYYLAITEFLETYFLGRTTTVAVEPDCSVPLDGDSMDRAVALLRSLDLDPDQPFFCLCPGSVNSEAKRWPDDCFRRLADLLAHGLDARVVFLGAPQERSLVDMIISGMQHPAALNLAGQADILTSMAIMNRSQLVISNDAGSAHLAVAASARVLTIFGPTIVGATAPYGPNAHVIQGEAPCAPCRHFLCPLPGHPCMRSVDPEAVFEKAEMILAEARGL